MSNSQAAMRWIAATRERAIRDRELELERLEVEDPAARDAVRLEAPPPPGERGLAFDAPQDPPSWLRVAREDVSVPGPLEQVSGLLQEPQLRWYESAARPLAKWVAEQPDAWVLRRHAELGDPTERFDRAGAREVLWIEVHRAPLDKRIAELDEKNSNAGGRMVVDDEGKVSEADGLSDPELREYNGATEKQGALNAQLSELAAANRDPMAWLADYDHNLVAAVYAGEVAIRREMELRTEVEVNVANPEQRIVDLVGPRREGEWEEVVRDLEYQRLSTLAHASQGVERDHWADRQAQNRIDAGVDRLREEHGMEPLAQQGVDGPDLGI